MAEVKTTIHITEENIKAAIASIESQREGRQNAIMVYYQPHVNRVVAKYRICIRKDVRLAIDSNPQWIVGTYRRSVPITEVEAEIRALAARINGQPRPVRDGEIYKGKRKKRLPLKYRQKIIALRASINREDWARANLPLTMRLGAGRVLGI